VTAAIAIAIVTGIGAGAGIVSVSVTVTGADRAGWSRVSCWHYYCSNFRQS